MKKLAVSGLASALLLVGCGDLGQSEQKNVSLETEIQRVSYGLGANLGARLGSEMDLDVAAFNAGVSDALTGEPMKMSEEQMTETLQAFQQKQIEERQVQAQAQAEANLEAAEAFLAANAGKDGVVVTDSGLQYKVIEQGNGEVPSADDRVEVHYRGTTIDGQEFDSSYARGEPVTFQVGGVIPGWTEALQLMPVGSKYELYIPPELAYGAGGAGNVIGPNSALVFEVELLDIKEGES